MAAGTGLPAEKRLGMAEAKLLAELRRMASPAFQTSLVLDVIVMAVVAVQAVVLGMDPVRENDPAASVVQNAPGGRLPFIHGNGIPGHRTRKQERNHCGNHEVSILQLVNPRSDKWFQALFDGVLPPFSGNPALSALN
jgi:hypothetical protein